MIAAGWSAGLAFILTTGVQSATPIALAGVGSTVAGQSGVFLVAMEAMMLTGAFTGLWAADAAGTVWAGLAAGAAGGVVMAVVFGYLVISRRASEIVVGVGVNLAAVALTATMLVVVFDSSGSYLSATSGAYPQLYDKVTWMAVVAVVLMVVLHRLLYSTRFGLRVRAIGRDDQACRATGLRVDGYRYCGVLLGGAACGIAGTTLALSGLSLFSIEMSAGLGFVALAAAMVGDNRPYQVGAAALLFGLAASTGIHLESIGWPSDFVLALPYLATIAAIIGKGLRTWSRAHPPAAPGPRWRRARLLPLPVPRWKGAAALAGEASPGGAT